MNKYLLAFPPTEEIKVVADQLKSISFDEVKCGIYSGNFRFCFHTEHGREFVTELDICAKRGGPFAASVGHRNCVLKEAFRNAVHEQILEVKQRHFATEPVQVCPLTFELYSFDTCHVDHGGKSSTMDKSLSFEALMHGFLNMYSQDCDMVYSTFAQRRADARINEFVKTIELTSSPPYEFRNTKLTKAWQEYHKVYAVLHVISRHANLFMQDLTKPEEPLAVIQPKRKRKTPPKKFPNKKANKGAG